MPGLKVSFATTRCTKHAFMWQPEIPVAAGYVGVAHYTMDWVHSIGAAPDVPDDIPMHQTPAARANG